MNTKKEHQIILPIEAEEVLYLQQTLLKTLRILSNCLETPSEEEHALCDSCYWLSRVLDATLEH